MRASTNNLTGRPSNIIPTTTASAARGGRRPVNNITNRVVNSQPVTRNNIAASKTTSTSEVDSKRKPKRAPWDMKGRLQDMEMTVNTFKSERDTFEDRLTDYNKRIELLEHEKQNLNQDLEQYQTDYLANRKEADKLSEILRREQTERNTEKQELQRKIDDMEYETSSLTRKMKAREEEIATKEEEMAGLKKTVSNMTSQYAGIEVQFSSTKMLLEERTKEASGLKEEVHQLKTIITTLENKLTDSDSLRRKLHNLVQELKGNIRVFCRVRPLLDEEIKNNGGSDVIHHINFMDDRTLELSKSADPNGSSMSGLKGRGGGTIEFSYDKVFQPNSTQAEVFEEISQLAQSVLDGYNVCVFAYGQTGSGKTFTMEGDHDNEELEGMIPRTVKHIFAAIKQLEDKGWSYKAEASFLEIYNENIRDLLATPKEAKNLSYDMKLVDNKKNDHYVTNLKVVPVTCEAEIQKLLKLAQQQRAVASTNMNERSSRSHSVFQLKLRGENTKTSDACEGTLNLVDLAGSERLKESGSEGARLTETQSINKSLSNLGNVIMALGQKQSHIPYRNSKLTHLLQSSLGGNSKTLMFVNVSPLEMCVNETLNSLRFATKVNQCNIGTATRQQKK
ncbi:hypothetical protein Pmani_014131 [Petrolisthes manimaculis]|uniref:Kinesin-like protein n=1 Tax=Petrolisthes manimaculis TaxID=1843537 RepID=A0AAE1PW03_9EUCA|nr:hypothetical protein Pmani_014131 [Petrolisthes manimaculis]